MCTQLLVSRSDEDNISCYLQLIDKCLNHEVSPTPGRTTGSRGTEELLPGQELRLFSSPSPSAVLHRDAEEEAVVMETAGPEAVPVHSEESPAGHRRVPNAAEVSEEAPASCTVVAEKTEVTVFNGRKSCIQHWKKDEFNLLIWVYLPAVASASPTRSPPPAASGAACRPGGASVSSRCPRGACRGPGWACWAAGGSWGPRLVAPAAPPPG